MAIHLTLRSFDRGIDDVRSGAEKIIHIKDKMGG